MIPDQAKDPRRQLQGAISRAKGKYFESRLDSSFEYYDANGFASIEKTPEPMRVLKKMDGGRFLACFEKKAQPDYKGTIKGGRTVMFEAKYTDSDRMNQDRVTNGKDGKEGQAEYLDKQHNLGARCYVLAGFASGEVYKIPWLVWRSMKAQFGRKYVTEADLKPYLVPLGWNNVLLLLD